MDKNPLRTILPSKSVYFQILVVCLLLIPSLAHASNTKTIEPGLRAMIVNGKEIFLTACPSDEYDISDWGARVLANPEKQPKFVSGKCLKIPLAELTEDSQLEVIRALFKKDSYDDKGWIHKVTYVSTRRPGGETLWNISAWFTGDPHNYKRILSYNGMSRRTKIYKGTTIKIPIDILSPAFKEPILFEIAARRAALSPSADSKRLNGDLTLKTDAQGSYGSYRIKKGDTIYSKVVMRFTDRVTATDVMEAVDIICKRSGIRDPRRLKAGDEIKLPLDLLSHMYLPPDDPRRQEYERLKREAQQYSNPIETAALEGILVILDAGHGGNDPGAIGRNKVYEDEISYDIMCRIKRVLESTTRAKVVPTILDKSENYDPSNASFFPNDKDEYVLTTPMYKNHDPKVSVNLRWYLANSIFREMNGNGTSADKIVFVSLHADALHPAARGTMVYVPGAYYCKGSGGKRGRVYTSRAEVREKQYVSISYKDRVRSEGLSTEFARCLIRSLAEYNIAVHDQKPIRNHIVRRRRSWAPAVIRHNIVPTKILVEVANLKNREDCELVASADFREKYANAFADALKEYYGER